MYALAYMGEVNNSAVWLKTFWLWLREKEDSENREQANPMPYEALYNKDFFLYSITSTNISPLINERIHHQ